jgi:hypothetical protein
MYLVGHRIFGCPQGGARGAQEEAGGASVGVAGKVGQGKVGQGKVEQGKVEQAFLPVLNRRMERDCVDGARPRALSVPPPVAVKLRSRVGVKNSRRRNSRSRLRYRSACRHAHSQTVAPSNHFMLLPRPIARA